MLSVFNRGYIFASVEKTIVNVLIMSSEIFHRFLIEHVMGNLWEIRAVGVLIQRENVPC